MERIQNLSAVHKLSIIAILEPFTDNSQLNICRMHLKMNEATRNPNGKIWIFWTQDVSCKVLESDDQQITYEFKHVEHPSTFLMTFIYAKCRDHLRRPLWDRLLQVATTELPWCTVGDFNVITDLDEKLGGIPYNMKKSFDFIGVIESCGLLDIGFHGQKYTWCNQRSITDRIWKRLDRAMVNDKWLECMPFTSNTHLSSVGSDYTPLLIEMKVRQENITRYFKFLNCWVENSSFLETVSNCWNRECDGNPMWRFHMKMKRLFSTLSTWSKAEYGDIFATVKEYEEKIRSAEEELIINNTDENRAT
ncbi:uncharacterized protein LOC124896702 [Capsicum annuum]|uniref:uncharacterized protein LOC124896702 n=1 Tax=Capsicum annuum TaxID=4072 RepID=UPI001FB0C074|nr:uncharacterized protein LOC124896702 [Capsicum annuum]XP_047264381.1 uncharacterized protein LOC124896702 [Capsicum annuum]XP_047264382.1 uncharacterized protein LOC124896702 [Capsicum annuum]XP_047264383.1 uncharacterized protein LOC124896702 [Capsicum annuum]